MGNSLAKKSVEVRFGKVIGFNGQIIMEWYFFPQGVGLVKTAKRNKIVYNMEDVRNLIPLENLKEITEEAGKIEDPRIITTLENVTSYLGAAERHALCLKDESRSAYLRTVDNYVYHLIDAEMSGLQAKIITNN